MLLELGLGRIGDVLIALVAVLGADSDHEASEVQGAQQAQATKQAGVTASVNKQLRALRTSVDAIQTSINTLNTTTAMQATDIKNLQKDVDKIDTRVSNLGG